MSSQGMDWGIIPQNLPWLWEGMQLTLALTALANLGGMLIGTALAVARLGRFRPLALAAAVYVNVFRSVPIVLAVFWFYFMVPVLLGRPIGAFWSVLIAFVFFEAAYFSEIIRAGIQGVRTGQVAAARATGLTGWQVLRHVVLPQAVRAMTPVLMTRAIVIFQDTSLAVVVGLTDFLTAANVVADRDGRPIEMYAFVAIVYFVLSSLAELGARWSRKGQRA
jgi:glutamate/aspartate transport system permease protein